MCVYMYVCVHACAHVYAYVYVYVYVYVYTCACVCAYVCAVLFSYLSEAFSHQSVCVSSFSTSASQQYSLMNKYVSPPPSPVSPNTIASLIVVCLLLLHFCLSATLSRTYTCAAPPLQPRSNISL